MIHWLFAAVLVLAQDASPSYFQVPLEELELAPDATPELLEWMEWGWGQDPWSFPRALLDQLGAAVYVSSTDHAQHWGESNHPLGWLFVRSDRPGPVTGTLVVSELDLRGVRRLAFTIPADRASGDASSFAKAQWLHYRRLHNAHLPGAAWFRHRAHELAGADAAAVEEPRVPEQEGDAELRTLSLFSGGRALAENLQLGRELPDVTPDELTVPIDTLEGITVRAFDWTAKLAKGETALDPLAAFVPADQHALFFPSFDALVSVLDEAEGFGAFGLAAFEERSADAHTRERIERQLCLELDAVARALGPMVIESVAITGSDAYLRTGSDVAVLLRCRDAKGLAALEANLVARQESTGVAEDLDVLGGDLVVQAGGTAVRIPTHDVHFAASSSRSVASYVMPLPDGDAATTLLVTNSPAQLARVVAVSGGQLPALASSDEYRFFRQRYAHGAAGESAFLVLPDAAIRRWCSPRWRIGAARRIRAAALLADVQAAHADEIVTGDVTGKTLGIDSRFPELGELFLDRGLVLSPKYGTLDFLTPIAELDIDKVSEREAELYRRWRDGYQSNWSNFFDPIAASISVADKRTAVDLTVMPLILGTDYADLREAARGPGLAATAGDPHAGALAHFTMQINLDWDELKKDGGSMVGAIGAQLGVEPLGWVGSWLTAYVDDSPLWSELFEAQDPEEALWQLEGEWNEIPVAVEVAVASPVKLALFLSAARAFVDSSAPGLTQWKDHGSGTLRYVEIAASGLVDDVSLFYATTPEALILSLNEETLLAAMERYERRRAGGESAPAATWAGTSVGLTLDGPWALRVLALLGEEGGNDVASTLRRASFRNLPILTEWHERWPDRDPVEVHERLFRERLECPGGGSYVWDETWKTMKSTVFGHPGEPGSGVRWLPAWDDLARASFALTFEDDGLRARVEIERR